MILLIDIGNTAIKWGCFDSQATTSITALGSERYHNNLPETVILPQWQALPKPTCVLVSHVGTRAIKHTVQQWIHACWQLEGNFIQENQTKASIKPLITSGILGVDRWLALLFLSQVEFAPFAVVGCGTAITFDVCQNHHHLGGLITPGVELMRLSLQEHTACCRLKADRQDTLNLLAADTDGAMRIGTLRMAAAFIENTLACVEAQHALSLNCFITGGDAKRLMPFFQTPDRFILKPALVLQGLGLFASKELSNGRSIKPHI